MDGNLEAGKSELLEAQVRYWRHWVEELEAENATLRATVDRLTQRVEELTQQVAELSKALALYQLLSPVNRGAALLMAALVLTSVPIGIVAETNRLAALRLLTGEDYIEALSSLQLYAQAMSSLDAWDSGILLAQVFWGLWLFPLGYLVLRSGFLPALLGILLFIAGAGNLLDSLLAILSPTAEVAISQFTFLGELAFPLWLLFKGVDIGQWQQGARGEGPS